ncbi:hypothetical protein GCM10009789_85180 [Kribbella sancticallisti]|uniref:PASTA domain-containing protein n=1 Tax=Kribbella sancticallisti TaxID=460087 RepID=A0ABP4QUJ8_9ACTN
MIEDKLTELLERAGDRTTVGPPPIEAMRVGATRLRRRRTVAVSLAGAAAVVVAAGGTTALVAQSGPEDPPAPAASASPSLAPTDLRLVGFGHAAIAVPKEWGTNELTCLTPHMDTVVIDPGGGHLCMHYRRSGVESVYLTSIKPWFGFHADETIEIDGVRAERQRTSCTGDTPGPVTVCSGAVFIPSLTTWFRAESSTNAAEVDRILERIRIVPDQVGVPAYTHLVAPRDGGSGEKYSDALTAAGLKPKIESTRSPSYPPGMVLDVSPAPGTMLRPGATVTVTVAS